MSEKKQIGKTAVLLLAAACILAACGQEEESDSLFASHQSQNELLGEGGESSGTDTVGASGSSEGAGETNLGWEIPGGQILEQSFDVTLDGWGQVTFAAFLPESKWIEGTKYGDVSFMLLQDGKAMYAFPGLNEENVIDGMEFDSVASVAFRDFDKDGRTDILLLIDYGGVQGIDIGDTFRETRIYRQEAGEKEFYLDSVLSSYLFLREYSYAENMEDVYQGLEDYASYYNVAVSKSAWEVERFAQSVKDWLVEGTQEDLWELCENIRFPITLDNMTYNDSEEFVAFFAGNINPEFRLAISQAPVQRMFANWQGVMLGDGGNNVWISEILNSDGTSQGLKVIGINGIASPELFRDSYVPEDWELEVAAIHSRAPYYMAASFHDEIVDYWENTREVRDVSNVLEPLYQTDTVYYTAEDFQNDPPLVIHLAKNEIYARRGYIFNDPDLYNYFMGCVWYTPTIAAEKFDPAVFNDCERANLELLAGLDTY